MVSADLVERAFMAQKAAVTAIEAAAQFTWDYGYTGATGNRGVWYDVEHPANGLAGGDVYRQQAGTVSISRSAAATIASEPSVIF